MLLLKPPFFSFLSENNYVRGLYINEFPKKKFIDICVVNFVCLYQINELDFLLDLTADRNLWDMYFVYIIYSNMSL